MVLRTNGNFQKRMSVHDVTKNIGNACRHLKRKQRTSVMTGNVCKM